MTEDERRRRRGSKQKNRGGGVSWAANSKLRVTYLSGGIQLYSIVFHLRPKKARILYSFLGIRRIQHVGVSCIVVVVRRRLRVTLLHSCSVYSCRRPLTTW